MKINFSLLPALFLCAGVFLSAVNIYGLLYPVRPLPAECGVPGYHYPARDGSKLAAMLEDPPGVESLEDLKKVNRVVFETIFHTGANRYAFRENYLLYLGGFFHEYLAATQNPERVIRAGGGLCNEICAVLKHLLEKSGVKSRYASLSGHVVLEVEVKNRRVVADPDFGIVYPYPLEKLETDSGAEIIAARMEDAGYPEETAAAVIDVFLETETNFVLPYGAELSPRLAAAERAAAGLRWILPAVLAAAGLAKITEKKESC